MLTVLYILCIEMKKVFLQAYFSFRKIESWYMYTHILVCGYYTCTHICSFYEIFLSNFIKGIILGAVQQVDHFTEWCQSRFHFLYPMSDHLITLYPTLPPREWSLSEEAGVSPEHYWIWLKQNGTKVIFMTLTVQWNFNISLLF